MFGDISWHRNLSAEEVIISYGIPVSFTANCKLITTTTRNRNAVGAMIKVQPLSEMEKIPRDPSCGKRGSGSPGYRRIASARDVSGGLVLASADRQVRYRAA